MRLWTMHPVEVWEKLEKDGVFRCDENLSDKDFKESYKWMVEQMDKRMNHPEGCVLPVWAWHTYNWKNKKPDLRESGFGVRKEKCVCLELEIPDEKVLLSDFNAWHYVLNRCWLDDSRNEEEYDRLQEWFDNLPGQDRERLRVESWQKIFDVEPYKDEWTTKGRYVQAVFWEIRKEYVKKVQFFTAR